MTIIRLRILFAFVALAACASSPPAAFTTNAAPAELTWSYPEHHVVLIWEDFPFKSAPGDWHRRFSDALAAKGVTLLMLDLENDGTFCASGANCWEGRLREHYNADYVLYISLHQLRPGKDPFALDFAVVQLRDTRTNTTVWENAISQDDLGVRDGVGKLLKSSPF
jgi:hypothetical protein